MTETNGGIALIEAAISNMATSKTALGYNEMDMKNLARFVFANWKHVSKKIDGLEADNARLCSELDQARGMVERLRKALEPFVALRDQSPCELAKVIHKGLDGVTPIAVTVTKDQYKAGCAALTSTERHDG